MKKKVLLLLSGELRAYDYPAVVYGWKKLFDKYDITTFLCCWDHRGRSLYSKVHHYNDGLQEDAPVDIENVEEVFNTQHVKLFNYNSWLGGPELEPWMKSHIENKFFNCIFAAFYLRKQVFNFAIKNIDKEEHNFDGVILTRPDMFFIRELPDYPFSECEYVWQQNPPECFYPNRVYDNFLFSGIENMEKVCNFYGSSLMSPSIENNFGTPNLNYLDACKVLYSFFHLAEIKHKSYDHLYTEPFRRIEDLKNHRDHYLDGNKMWCEE